MILKGMLINVKGTPGIGKPFYFCIPDEAENYFNNCFNGNQYCVAIGVAIFLASWRV